LQSLFENLKIHWNSTSQKGSSLESVEVHSLTLSHTNENMKCDSRASLLARTFASPYVGHEPQARVMTILILWMDKIFCPCE